MTSTSFNCVLKFQRENSSSSSWEAIEAGRGTVYDDLTADFKSSFVPFFPVGTTLRIYRLVGKEEVSYFEGKVYLTSGGFIRLTAIKEVILESSVRFFSSQLSIMARCQLAPKHSALPIFVAKKKFEIEIFELTEAKLKFTSNESSIPVGSELIVSFSSPFRAEEILCQVYEVLSISQKEGENGKSTYLSKILSLSQNDLENISSLCSRLKEENAKILK